VTTYSGHSFSPLNPDAEAIDIKDIAHALARIGRANGHFVEFYSVGQHCLDCAQEALARGYGARQALVCLLHDASEAYLSDITSPVKKHLRQYMETEDNLLDVIYQKYVPGGIRPKEQRAMKEIDNAMLYHEFVHFMGEQLADTEPQLLHEPCFQFTSFWSVEKQYLFLFDQLTAQMQQASPQQSWQTMGIVYADGQWQAAVLDGASCHFVQEATLQALCDTYREVDAVLTDLPVGLPEDANDAALRPEPLLRRKYLNCTVITAPCRQAVYADTDVAAREENIRVLGRTLSSQQMQLRGALRELDDLFTSQNQWKNVLRQSHPQLLYDSRRLILQQYQDAFVGRNHPALMDALCLAVIGQMESRAGSDTIPARPRNDAKGIRMQIVVPHVK